MNDEQTITNYFFTNADRPVFALRNSNPAIQNYIYSGVSRFPQMRERLAKLLSEKGALEKTAEAIRNDSLVNALEPAVNFMGERNKALYFDMRHGSSAEGSTAFVVSENNPIYATEEQQDFYWPMTTMETSTRYSKKFDIGRVYWDPTLMKSEFANEAKETVAKNFGLYGYGYEPVLDVVRDRLKDAELKENISVLDSLRSCIPLAAYTSIILGGNTRAVYEHLRKMMASGDNFMKEYTSAAAQELAKINPHFFGNVQPDAHTIERNRRLREYADNLFGRKFQPVKEDVTLFYNCPPEEAVLAQIIYPFVSVPFETVLKKTLDFSANERTELFGLANLGRENRRNPIRGYETRHLIYEVETGFSLWKDFKRNRMNLRFHQDMRGLAGWSTPDMIAESGIAKDYENAQRETANLMEKVYDKYGSLGRAVATQGSRKRYLLCMGPRQLTVLGELRTCGEGDRGYRKIASRMIELAVEKNPRLFGHINDNYKAK